MLVDYQVETIDIVSRLFFFFFFDDDVSLEFSLIFQALTLKINAIENHCEYVKYFVACN